MRVENSGKSSHTLWGKVVSLVLQTPLTPSEWHWHGDKMRRQLPDGEFAFRDPTDDEIRDDLDRQAW